ncbi:MULTISPECIES: helix-turn-helix transcriptional regulator [unclassified Veillonella]|uniref:helix-turn-helix domain-containing protein n=1 Tax=unclassified Veillonella TaxID=2630086 RepID=UPI000F8E9DFA
MKIYENIKKKCKEKGVSIAKLERSVKLSVGSISHWRTSNPKLSNVKAVADYLQCTIDELL